MDILPPKHVHGKRDHSEREAICPPPDRVKAVGTLGS